MSEITKHVDEYRLGERVQLGDGLPAFGSERVGGVEDGCDTPLLVDGRERDRDLLQLRCESPRCGTERSSDLQLSNPMSHGFQQRTTNNRQRTVVWARWGNNKN